MGIEAQKLKGKWEGDLSYYVFYHTLLNLLEIWEASFVSTLERKITICVIQQSNSKTVTFITFRFWVKSSSFSIQAKLISLSVIDCTRNNGSIVSSSYIVQAKLIYQLLECVGKQMHKQFFHKCLLWRVIVSLD